jgi:hypothetical protein
MRRMEEEREAMGASSCAHDGRWFRWRRCCHAKWNGALVKLGDKRFFVTTSQRRVRDVLVYARTSVCGGKLQMTRRR